MWGPYLLHPKRSPSRFRSRRRKRTIIHRLIHWWSLRTVKVELLSQTERAVQVRDAQNRVMWIPKVWIEGRRKLDPTTWEIKITKPHWDKLTPLDIR